MKRMFLGILIGVTALVFTVAATLADERVKTSESNPTAACMDMMQGKGVTEEGKKAMREFMESDRAPQAMANMMEMARRMGNGDPMLGMTRMMEMMGGQGGMMGGQGGMMQPGGAQPGK